MWKLDYQKHHYQEMFLSVELYGFGLKKKVHKFDRGKTTYSFFGRIESSE